MTNLKMVTTIISVIITVQKVLTLMKKLGLFTHLVTLKTMNTMVFLKKKQKKSKIVGIGNFVKYQLTGKLYRLLSRILIVFLLLTNTLLKTKKVVLMVKVLVSTSILTDNFIQLKL